MQHYIGLMLLALHAGIALLTIGHALLYKRDSRSALGWIATCILFPIAGPILYFFFGINRVSSRAKKLLEKPLPDGRVKLPDIVEPAQPDNKNIVVPAAFSELAAFSSAVTDRPLLSGNRVELLENGEQAYPAMLDAIRQARESVYLSTYIFKTDRTGNAFIQALQQAQRRGLDIKVLVDGYGDFYYFPRASRRLKQAGINVRSFLPLSLLPPSAYINLRNHRKLLIADGRVAFTGGMNIGDHHLAANDSNPRRVTDLHFRFRGPVVEQLETVFLHDWVFTTRQDVTQTPNAEPESGPAICRTITDGPDNNIDKITLSLVSAVSAARRSVAIMTPYFLPPRELIGALQAAALRGVDVCVMLPAKNNLFYVHRATRNLLWELLQQGVKVCYQPPPFAHGKLFLVDDHYAQVGSANLDPRSLRLNFEIAVEIYSPDFTRQLREHFDRIRHQSRQTTLDEVDNRPLFSRMIDAVFWLFSPYM